jgi:hypothetical protein
MGDKSLREWIKEYFRAHWQRVLEDTYAVMKEHGPLEVGIALASGLLAFFVQYYSGEQGGMRVVFFSILTAFTVILLVFAAVFLWHFFTAPFRIYRDNQEAIAGLKDQIEMGLNLDIPAPVVSRISTAVLPEMQGINGGWMVVLQNARFTNRSTTTKVSLDLTLRIKLKDSPTTQEYLSIREDYLRPLGKSARYLVTPINLGPQDTKTGDVGFLIMPITEHNLGGSDVIDHNHCLLEIVDHVSGRAITKTIDQHREGSGR